MAKGMAIVGSLARLTSPRIHVGRSALIDRVAEGTGRKVKKLWGAGKRKVFPAQKL